MFKAHYLYNMLAIEENNENGFAMAGSGLRVSFDLPDADMPRTVFWERFSCALRANWRYVDDPARADLLFPAEDAAMETNWPRYGRGESALLRGRMDWQQIQDYLNRFLSRGGARCLVNMHPFMRAPQVVGGLKTVFVADICLPAWERSLNPRTVSMPALPISVGEAVDCADRPILASFRGALSHPCRGSLAKLHDGEAFHCELVDPGANHAGRIDATLNMADPDYAALMKKSVFALVPRGDCLFSYRLLEAISFGCIPVILADGWVLPFDRSITWPSMSLVVPEAEIPSLSDRLCRFSPSRLEDMRLALRRVWHSRLRNLEVIVETLLAELEMACGKGW